MRILILANPVAGRGRGVRLARRLSRLLERRGHAVELHVTTARDDARRVTRRRASRLDALVVAAGDGTLNEVLNGLPEPDRVPLLPLAVGTGNMLARELCLPTDPEVLAALIEARSMRRIDLGELEGHRFLSLVGIGFDALVAARIARTRRGRLPLRSYARPILEVAWGYRPPRLSVAVDGAPPLTGGYVLVSNLRNYGGVLEITRGARCDSGVLHVFVLERARTLDLARAALRASLRIPFPREGILESTGRTLRVGSTDPVAVQVDGDFWGTTPVTIAVRPAAVRILAPAYASSASPHRGGAPGTRECLACASAGPWVRHADGTLA